MKTDAIEISEASAREAFLGHLVDKATAARMKYGLYIDAEAIVKMLADSDVLRYPASLVFDAGPLQPHEFACVQPLGFHAADGYAICLHPAFRDQPEIWPLLISYHVPAINYGQIVDTTAAEIYGSTLIGLDREAYYQALCELADSIGCAPLHEAAG
ncbi:MAG: hypothetical protein HKN62_11535 [Phycisphaerales bacterium]|nr:hypothetical protein [Phycisphaerales bacterium]